MKIVLAVLLSLFGPTYSGRCYPAPVTGSVVQSFRAPGCLYCSGHRGLEYQTIAGSAVTAVASGVVTFAGVVVGVRYVVVRQDDGLVATYGMLSGSGARAGDLVATAQIVGSTAESFYFGLRDDGVYVDPAPFIGRVVYQPRLIPIDGRQPRPTHSTGLRCGPPPSARPEPERS